MRHSFIILLSLVTILAQPYYDNFQHLIAPQSTPPSGKNYDNFRFLENNLIRQLNGNAQAAQQKREQQQKKVKKDLRIDVFKINNITSDDIYTNRSSIHHLSLGALDIADGHLTLDSNTKIRIANFTITMSEFESLLKFNSRLIHKCGPTFGYCQIIQKYDITSKAVQQSKAQLQAQQQQQIQQQQRRQADSLAQLSQMRLKQKQGIELPFNEETLEEEVNEMIG